MRPRKLDPRPPGVNAAGSGREERARRGPARASFRPPMPISPERVLRALDRRNRPLLSPAALLRVLGADRNERRRLASVLRRLVDQGRVEHLRGRYRLARSDALVEGEVESLREGVARVRDDRGARWQVAGAGSVRAGERVLIEPRPEAPGRAALVRAIGGARGEWVGVLDRDGALLPWREDPRGGGVLRVPRSDWRGARAGDVVSARMLGRPPGTRADAGRRRRGRRTPPGRVRDGLHARPEGRVVEVFGPLGTPEADFRAIVWRHRLPLEFPPEALAEAEALDAELRPEDRAGRLDLRDRPFVTIDPATARDHDDAVCVERLPRATRLWVAIADVSHHVPEDSALDLEARRRGNSVYFPDRAIPMLPERLSGDLCSLRPGTDRLALAVALDLGRDGRVRRSELHTAVIRSRARLVYDEAALAMEGVEAPGIRDEAVREQLAALADVARRLTARRFAGGAIDFDLPTAEIVLGDEGHPTDIIESPRTLAHRAIEEAMLVANRAVAEWLLAHDLPAIFRVHEPPLPEALDALEELLASFGLLERRSDPLDSGALSRALQRAAGRPEERLVHSVALRSLRQARYDASNRGHFALAFDAYLHFTSPIRRYADLAVHRQLHDGLATSPTARSRALARGERFPAWGAALSHCERAAMEAERDAVDLKKCVFLRAHVGEQYDATVTRMSRHGVHVTLDPFFVEGMIPVRYLPGRWELDERGVTWTARDGERLELGDRLRVVVARVELQRGWIDFGLVRRLERRL
jgi:ribonuclease R